MSEAGTAGKPGPLNLITDVDGVTVGNAVDAKVGTGTTVVLPDNACVGAVDVAGGGPGTRETDLLNPENLVDAVDAVVLSGGSSYGLAAASGVADWLGARGRGYLVGPAPRPSPIVPAAILFDLLNCGNKDWGETSPYDRLGREAVAAAERSFVLGNAGAGYGAQAGLVKGGLGSASALAEDGLQVGAVVAVNSVGSTLIPGTNRFWAWAEEQDAEFGGLGAPEAAPDLSDLWAETKAAARPVPEPGQNTTLAVIATNAALTTAAARRVARMAQNGLARAIRPVHTFLDGDTVFVLATGGWTPKDGLTPLALSRIGQEAASVVARAVARGVYEADSLFAIGSYRDRFTP